MPSTLGQFVPVPLQPQAYTSGPVTALRVQNGSPYRLRVILGGQLYDACDPGADQTYNVANLTGFGGWILLIPGKAPLLNSPLTGPVTITSYGGGDTIPYGTQTQNSEALYSPFPDSILDTMGGDISFRLKVFGVRADGVTDDTAAIQACENAASICGGGELIFPAATVLAAGLVKASHVTWRGSGATTSFLKLKNGANADLVGAFQANININNQTSGNGSTTGITAFTIRDMTLDGNYTNQSSGPCWPLRFYGYGYVLQNLDVRNGYSGGIQCDWNGGLLADNRIEATWENVRVYNNLGTSTSIGIEWGEQSDGRWVNVLSYINNSHDVHLGPHGGALQMSNCHFWNSNQNNLDPNAVTFLAESLFYATNCEFEGSNHAQLVLLANSCRIWGGAIFGADATHNGDGVRLGQAAGLTPYTNSAFQNAGLTTAVSVSSYRLETTFNQCYGAGGAIVFNNATAGTIRGDVIARNATDNIFTGTPPSGAWLQLQNFGFNDARKQIDEVVGTSGGEFARGMSSSAPDPGNNGTINTAGLWVSRVLPVANETGLILQAGTRQGQIVIVENLSAFTLTFAAVGTSHVADGVSDVIPANTSRAFNWDSSNNFWLRFA